MQRVALVLLVAFPLSAGSCLTTTHTTVTIGDFCTTARPMVPRSEAVLQYLNEHDPRLVEDMINQNTFGELFCEWRF